MAFCGKCGTPINGGKYCPKCGSPVETKMNDTTGSVPIHTTSKSSKKGLWIKVLAGVAVVVLAILITSQFVGLSKEPCDWCGHTPSVAYQTSDGSEAYVCKECSKKCAWCGAKAKCHYENLLENIVFVCDDCYDDLAR